MARPTDPALLWASDTNYPAGGDTWSATPTKVVPSAGVIAAGSVPATKLPAQWFNALLHRLGLWGQYLEETTDPHDIAIGGGSFDREDASPLEVVRTSTLVGGASGLAIVAPTGTTGLATADLQTRLKVPVGHAITGIRVVGRYARDASVTCWLVQRTPLGAATRTVLLTFTGGGADLVGPLDESGTFVDPAWDLSGPSEIEIEIDGSADPSGFIAIFDVILTVAPA